MLGAILVLEAPYDGNITGDSDPVGTSLRPQDQHKRVSTSDNEKESDGGSEGSENDMKCGGEMSAHIDEVYDEPYIDKNAEDSEASPDCADLLDDAADRGRADQIDDSQNTPDKIPLDGASSQEGLPMTKREEKEGMTWRSECLVLAHRKHERLKP